MPQIPLHYLTFCPKFVQIFTDVIKSVILFLSLKVTSHEGFCLL